MCGMCAMLLIPRLSCCCCLCQTTTEVECSDAYERDSQAKTDAPVEAAHADSLTQPHWTFLLYNMIWDHSYMSTLPLDPIVSAQ
jgi:hypothetical protein